WASVGIVVSNVYRHQRPGGMSASNRLTSQWRLFYGDELYDRCGAARAQNDVVLVAAGGGLAIVIEKPVVALFLAFALLAVLDAQVLEEHILAAARVVGTVIAGNCRTGS